MSFNIDRQLIKPTRRGYVGDSSASCSTSCPTMGTSGTTTTIKHGCEPPSPTPALGDSSPVLPVRCHGHVSKEMEEEDTPATTTSQSLLCDKKGKKEKKTRKSNSNALSSSPSAKQKTTPHNLRKVPRASNNLDSNIATSYSSQRAHQQSKQQQGSRYLVSSALSPISEDHRKKISIHRDLCDALVLGCEDGESPRFKSRKMTRHSLRRPSVKRDIIGPSSRYVLCLNEQRKQLSDSEARRQLIGKSVIAILDEADEIIDGSSMKGGECMEKSLRRNSDDPDKKTACDAIFV
jgi:hypothetical protein